MNGMCLSAKILENGDRISLAKRTSVSLRITSLFDADSADGWRSFISDMAVKRPSCFLTIKSYDFKSAPTGLVATIEFQERAKTFPAFLQRRAETGAFSVSEFCHILQEILQRCLEAGEFFDYKSLSYEMMYVVEDGSLRLVPYINPSYEHCGGLSELLLSVASVGVQSEAARRVCEELAGEASTADCKTLLGKLQEQTEGLLQTPHGTDECAQCKAKLSPPSHQICSKHFLCENDFRDYIDTGCIFCSTERTKCSMCGVHISGKSFAFGCCSQVCSKKFKRSLQKAEQGLPLEGSKSLCLHCRVSPRREPLIPMSCGQHCFCSFTCCKEYRAALRITSIDLGFNCLVCMKSEEEIAKEFPSLQEKLTQIAELKRAVVSGSDSAVRLKAALGEFQALQRLREGEEWSVSLSADRLRDRWYLLKCLVCGEHVGVPRWPAEELSLWRSAPFLVKCEWRLHAVCSEACFSSLGPKCPICEESPLRLDLKSTCPENSHATLEALRRFPAVACRHLAGMSETLPYLSCSHEVCLQCLSEEVFDSYRTEYSCPICFSVSDRDTLSEEAFA